MTQTHEPATTYEEALDRAARLWGIEPEFCDTFGKSHTTTPAIQKAILAALGVDIENQETLDRAVEQRLVREWDNILPPVFVAGRKDWAAGFPIRVPTKLQNANVTVEFRWETGGTKRNTVPLSHLASAGRAELARQSYVQRQVPIPQDAHLGYHEVEVTVRVPKGRAKKASMRLILCPDRAYTPPEIEHGGRTAGLAIALYGLRSERNWGCGDFTDLENFTSWVSDEVGANFLGLNPLHAISNRHPYNISPYLPASTFYKNPIYLDLERIEDFQRSPRARAWANRPEVKSEIAALRQAEFVNYERVWALKLCGLKLAFASFLHEYRAETPRAAEFREFVAKEGDLLHRFALWCALDDWIHRHNPDTWIWPEWPEEFREPDSLATRSFAEKYWRLVLFYKYAQWQVSLQLDQAQRHTREQGLTIGIFHDLALATDRFGADLWAYRPFYVNGCRVGAPPDGFSPKGQDWSFPPPATDQHRDNGYRLFTESIRKNCRYGGALRMDHVMRFFRLYWIPAGMEPDQGAYVRDRFEDLLHILALESVRQKVVVVGEDLGTVTPEIRHALDRFGIYGYKVPYFEKNEQGRFKLPHEYAEQAVVTSSTHDLPTLAGFWLGRDIEARQQCGLLQNEEACRQQHADRTREKQYLLDALFAEGLLPDWVPRNAEHIPELTGELHNALIGWIATAPCRFLALNQEDLLKVAEQQNLPATTSEYPNWQRKMRFTVEELSSGAARDYTGMFRNWLRRTGRLHENSPEAKTA